MLNDEIDFISETFDESVIVYVDTFLLGDKYEVIFRKDHFVLLENVAKINASIFDFEKVFAGIVKDAKIRDKGKNDANIIDSIRIHENMNFFLNGQARFGIKNFESIDEVTIVINMHFLLKGLFSGIEFITIFVVFDNVRKLF